MADLSPSIIEQAAKWLYETIDQRASEQFRRDAEDISAIPAVRWSTSWASLSEKDREKYRKAVIANPPPEGRFAL